MFALLIDEKINIEKITSVKINTRTHKKIKQYKMNMNVYPVTFVAELGKKFDY